MVSDRSVRGGCWLCVDRHAVLENYSVYEDDDRREASKKRGREKEDEKNSAMITLLLLFVAVVVVAGGSDMVRFGSVCSCPAANHKFLLNFLYISLYKTKLKIFIWCAMT